MMSETGLEAVPNAGYIGLAEADQLGLAVPLGESGHGAGMGVTAPTAGVVGVPSLASRAVGATLEPSSSS